MSLLFALVFSRDGRTERHLLATGDTVVGRAPTCDLVISDPSISRRHARFRVHGDHCLLTDVGGRNGTFRNGELVSETELAPGDTVTLGRFSFRVQRAEDAGLALGDHAPQLESPSTICRRLDEASGTSGAWRPSVDSGRLFNVLPIIARRMLRPHSLPQLHQDIVGAIFEALPAERAFLLLTEPQAQAIVPFIARTREGGAADGSTVSRTIVERVIAERILILSTDVLPDSNTPTGIGPAAQAKRWFVCAPLWGEDEPLGALYADSPETITLGMADLDVMHALALCAGAALLHAREDDRLLSAARGTPDAPAPPTDKQ